MNEVRISGHYGTALSMSDAEHLDLAAKFRLDAGGVGSVIVQVPTAVPCWVFSLDDYVAVVGKLRILHGITCIVAESITRDEPPTTVTVRHGKVLERLRSLEANVADHERQIGELCEWKASLGVPVSP